MLIVGSPVNVDDVACAMFHGLHLCSGDQSTLVSGVGAPAVQRGSRRMGYNEDLIGLQIGVAMG